MTTGRRGPQPTFSKGRPDFLFSRAPDKLGKSLDRRRITKHRRPHASNRRRAIGRNMVPAKIMHHFPTVVTSDPHNKSFFPAARCTQTFLFLAFDSYKMCRIPPPSSERRGALHLGFTTVPERSCTRSISLQAARLRRYNSFILRTRRLEDFFKALNNEK